jgi:glucosamine 6-phosphate synthetase-like amidotransferase/phosphosugar isomerase protein
MDKHRQDYKRWKNDKFNYITSFQLFDEYGLENCFIELLEGKECKSKDELRQLEGKYIRELVCVNQKVAGQTRKEYYEENKVEISEQKKLYREDNKQKISEQQKQKYERTKEKILERQSAICVCECGANYTHGHKMRHLQSRNHRQFIESK